MYKKFLKRWLDFTLASLILTISFPVLIVIWNLIRLKLGRPILFKQNRPGKDGNIFTMYKFRTMTDEKDTEGNHLSDNQRLTKFGAFLRKTSLDEIPGLINVLKGEMSLVGPRPLAEIYLPYYTQRENQRHSVLPGLTGLAQVNGRNTLNWEDRFEYDIEYANNINFSVDLKIILLTIKKVFQKDGVVTRGSSNITDFHTHRINQMKRRK